MSWICVSADGLKFTRYQTTQVMDMRAKERESLSVRLNAIKLD